MADEPIDHKKMWVFLSHASEDKPTVRRLCKQLKADGFDPWLDEERLLPGQDWNLEIEQALRNSAAILLCFSTVSVSKEGYVQREYKRAMQYREEKPEGMIYVIPVRLDDCPMPFFMRELQWVDYPEQYDRLLMALQQRQGTASKIKERGNKKMKKKGNDSMKKPESSTVFKFGTVNIEKFIAHDQNNYHYGNQIFNLASVSDFSAALQEVKTQVQALQQQTHLTQAEKESLQQVEQEVAEAAQQAAQPKPDGKSLVQTLKKARETLESLSGSVTAAVGLGTLLGKLIESALRFFGG